MLGRHFQSDLVSHAQRQDMLAVEPYVAVNHLAGEQEVCAEPLWYIWLLETFPDKVVHVYAVHRKNTFTTDFLRHFIVN